MSEIKIVGLHIRDHVKKNGEIDLAVFDCVVSGIRMIGCMLAKTPAGGFRARAPIVPSERVASFTGAVDIVDNSMRHRITEAARHVYLEFGGKHGEFAKSASASQSKQVEADEAEAEAEAEAGDDRAGLLAVLNVQQEKTT